MLDDDDVEFVALAWSGGGWVIGVLGIIVLVIMMVIVSGNKDDCAKLSCPHGSPKLMEHECLCVDKAQ
jgi:hypothetical protein